jgi:hypothetical protein
MACPFEPAIPAHLQKERTCPAKLQPNFTPPFPGYTSRFPHNAKDIVTAVVGVQYKSKTDNDGEAIAKIRSFMEVSSSTTPAFWDLASVTDNTGAYNIAILGDWASTAQYHEWTKESGFGEWWESLDNLNESHGWFLEVLMPSMDRWEHVASGQDVREAGGRMCEYFSEPILEHGYWGSMRDRIPVTQTDALEGSKRTDSMVDGANKWGGGEQKDAGVYSHRVRVQGQKNLCVIRSGQDWSATRPEERKLYLEKMHPTLIKGMEFLRDKGDEVGCYSNRFMEILNPGTGIHDTDKTFGLAYFDELASLEGWSKKHKTHLDIFGGFLKYTKDLNFEISLKLWHDVMVLKPEQQFFEYVGCHDGTGMLALFKGKEHD